MKLKYIIPSFIAVIAMFTGCSDDNEPTYLDNLKVSSSYVAFDVEGGTQEDYRDGYGRLEHGLHGSG